MSTDFTYVRVTESGTSFSDRHAVVQAWQPMQRDWSMTLAQRGGRSPGSVLSRGRGSLTGAGADEVAEPPAGAARAPYLHPRSPCAACAHGPRGSGPAHGWMGCSVGDGSGAEPVQGSRSRDVRQVGQRLREVARHLAAAGG